MNEKVQMARRLVAETSLEEIRMSSGRFASDIASAAEVEEPVMTIEHSAKALRDEEEGFRVSAMLRLSIFEGKGLTEEHAEPGDAVAKITATYELSYGLPASGEFTDEALMAFAETNGVFNAWPYFREFVQSSASRMGLPAVLVPLFRLPIGTQRRDDAGDKAKT